MASPNPSEGGAYRCNFEKSFLLLFVTINNAVIIILQTALLLSSSVVSLTASFSNSIEHYVSLLLYRKKSVSQFPII